MDRRERILRRRMRRRANRLRRDDTTRKQIEQILADEEMFDVFAGDVIHRHEGECCSSEEFGATFGNPFQQFLTWLVDNWPAILEMIQAIIDLFTSSESLHVAAATGTE